MTAIRPLSPSFGAEVLEFELSSTPSAEQVATIRGLWADHKLLLFRNQSFDEAALVGFSKEFGALAVSYTHLRAHET